MRTLYSALVLGLVGWAGAASAAQAVGPVCDESMQVLHTTYYYCNGGYHGGVALSGGTCGVSNVRGMLVGTFYWNVSADCPVSCSAPGTCSNYAWVNGSNGYRFYQYHFIANANSYSRTCDRCVLGLLGPKQVRAVHYQYSTQLTAWYSGYAICGSKGGCGYILGYPRMS